MISLEYIFKDADEIYQYLGADKYKEFSLLPFELNQEAIYDFIENSFPVVGRKGEDYTNNAETYDKLIEVSAEDYYEYLEGAYDDIADQYMYGIEEYMKDGDAVNEDETNFSSLVEGILRFAVDTSEFNERFEEVKDQYLVENEDAPYFNEEEDGFGYEAINETEQKSVKEADELLTLNDSVGMTVYIEDEYIDYDTRDYAFIYADGNIIYGSAGQTHSDLLTEYLQEEGRSEDIPKDMKDRLDNGDVCFSRPSKKRVQRLTNSEDIAFGHVVNDCAFIETMVGSVSQDSVADKCMDELGVEKVYMYDRMQSLVKRLAKTVRRKVVRLR